MLHNLSRQLLVRAMLQIEAVGEAVCDAAHDAAHDVAHDAARNAVHDVAHDAACDAPSCAWCSAASRAQSVMPVSLVNRSLLCMSVRSLAAREGWRLYLRKCTSHATSAVFELEVRKCNSRSGQVAISQLEMRERAFRYTLWHWSAFCRQELAIFQSEPRERTLHTTFALKSCEFRGCATRLRFSSQSCSSRTTCALESYDFAAGAAGMRFAYYFCTFKLRVLQPDLWERFSSTTFVLKTCDCSDVRLAYCFCT